jgi:ATP-binding cassette subfamily B protein
LKEIKSIEFLNIGYNFFYNYQACKNVFVKFDGSKNTISGVPSSGKSTFIKIMAGIFPIQRKKLLINGKIPSCEEVDFYLSKISYVPQEANFFSGNLKENIFFDKKINNYQKILYLSALDKDFETGLLSFKKNVGCGGVELSGGQKRRISIARALSLKPELLLVDNLTAGLDVNTARVLSDRILNCKDFTKVVVE